MNEKKLGEIIHSIPLEMWENHLPIGKVHRLEIENILCRKYSDVAKCFLMGSKGSFGVYVKSYRNYKNLQPAEVTKQVKTDYQTLVYYNGKFNGSNEFGVVKPLFILPEKHILVTLEASGVTLSDAISQNCRFLASEKTLQPIKGYVTQAGAWLKYFQSLDDSNAEPYSIDTLIEYMNVRLKILTEDQRRRFPSAFWQRILEYVEENSVLVDAQELYVKPSHNDFNLGNVIIDGERVTALDFTKIKKDIFLLDISRVYHQLFLMTFKPQYKISVIRELQRALLEGFGMPNADQLMMFRFLLIRHTLTHLVGITRFWEKSFQERLYNHWVLYRELRFVDSLLSERSLMRANKV